MIYIKTTTQRKQKMYYLHKGKKNWFFFKAKEKKKKNGFEKNPERLFTIIHKFIKTIGKSREIETEEKKEPNKTKKGKKKREKKPTPIDVGDLLCTVWQQYKTKYFFLFLVFVVARRVVQLPSQFCLVFFLFFVCVYC